MKAKIYFIFLFIATNSLLFSQNFITTWQTDNPGSSNGTSITIPTFPGETYNYNVDWNNDGVFDEFGLTGDVTHNFGFSGNYTISIGGNFPRIYFNNEGDRQKLLSLNQWGTQQWTSMERAFYGCNNLHIDAIDTPNLTNVTSTAYMFKDVFFINDDLNDWDVSNVTNMDSMFFNAGNVNIVNWDVSNVTNMARMFALSSFNQNINGWDVSNVIDMEFMFFQAFFFNQNLGGWDVSNVTNMEGMFYLAYNFNQNLNSWNTSNVVNMSFMFCRAKKFNGKIDNWDTSNVTNMNFMFYRAEKFNQNLNNWNTSNVTSMQQTFYKAVDFEQSIGSWDVSNVTSMYKMFVGVTLSTENYDDILQQWDAQSLQDNVAFHGGRSKYCNGQTARDNMILNNNWTINDGGKKIICSGLKEAKQYNNSTLKNNTDYKSSSIKLYPNPASGILFLEGLDKKADIKVMDLTGKIMLHIDSETAKNRLDVSKLKSAIYFIRITTENDTVVKQFIKD